MSYQAGIDRDQAALFPMTIEELIPQEHLVRIIDLFIQNTDLKKLGFSDEHISMEGRPGYDPKDLLKLYLYGYLNRIRTSRLLERECIRNIELIWLLKGLTPCFRTISGFRSENAEGLKNLFRYFVQLLKEWNLVGGENIAIDSSKFRAVNSKKNNFNPRKIERQLLYIEGKIARYLKELDQADQSDGNKVDIQQDLIKQLSRKIKYNDLKKKLGESNLGQISTTDPDSRSMILHGSVIEVAYNIQTAVDDKNSLIVHYQATNQNDRKALHPIAKATKAILEKEQITVLADKGYHNAEQIHACKEDGIETYVAVQDTPRKNEIPTERYYGEKFEYDEIQDTFTCPQGSTLSTNGNWYNKKYENYITKIKHYKTKSCGTCTARNQCTTNPHGRIIERSEYAKAVEENKKRMETNLKRYLLRQQIVEHPFGTIKRQFRLQRVHKTASKAVFFELFTIMHRWC